MKGHEYMEVELHQQHREFEQTIPHEVERKFIPLFPEQLEPYRAEALPIEQYYLSHPTEEFSLRMRERLRDGSLVYEATLKDAGLVTPTGIDRLEVTTEITEELYSQYKTDETPYIRKLRAEPITGVTIDFYEDGRIQIESENESSWQTFIARENDAFVEITGDKSSCNEWQAHLKYRRLHNGDETLQPGQELSVDDIVRDVLLAVYQHRIPVCLHVAGRSGSGKSTMVRSLQERLAGLRLSSQVISTDDYHRGHTWLEAYNNGTPWQHWDDPIVYDTITMAADLAQLRAGNTIPKREIDWQIVEPCYPGTISPSDVIVIEGVYAQSPDITADTDLQYEMTTPLATCIGRRIIRDITERPDMADPSVNLRYMLTDAEPAYRAQRHGVEATV